MLWLSRLTIASFYCCCCCFVWSVQCAWFTRGQQLNWFSMDALHSWLIQQNHLYIKFAYKMMRFATYSFDSLWLAAIQCVYSFRFVFLYWGVNQLGRRDHGHRAIMLDLEALTRRKNTRANDREFVDQPALMAICSISNVNKINCRFTSQRHDHIWR